MREWKSKITIKHLLNGDATKASVIFAASNIIPLIKDVVTPEIIDNLQFIADGKSGVHSVQAFNNALSDLYDWADENSVGVE